MFDFFRKLFKALNSSGKAWQLSVAVILAMFAGFLPGSSLILFDILFIALVLNVNFGLFLLFSVIFSGIGYIFDPLFESLGYMILTNEAFNGLFTMMYNSTLIRWSSFNYTLITGSLAVSTVLALPMFFILNKIVTLYRVQIGQKLNEWKLTRWMKLFNEEAKSSALFRWWGLGVFGALTTAIVLFLVLLFDPLAKMTLEKTLSYSLQTEVTIKEFSSSLSDLRIKISGVEIADRDKLTHNLVEFDSMEFDLGLSALMEKKTMIEKLSLNALAFDQQREKAAHAYAASEEEATREDEKAEAKSEGTDTSFSMPDVDDILAKEELRSIKEAQDFKADVEQTQKKWERISKELEESDDLDTIQADAKALEKRLKGASLKDILAAKGEVDTLKKKIDALKSKYKTLKQEYRADKERLALKASELKELPDKDIKRLMQKYSLDANGGANVISTLVNDEVALYLKKAVKYYSLVKPYLNSSADTQAEEETIPPPRGVGRWIHYTDHSKIPSLVIKKAEVGIILAEDRIHVNIQDISSDQKLYGKPMVAHADAKGEKYRSLVANLVDDRRTKQAKSEFELKLRDYSEKSIEMSGLTMDESLINVDLKGGVVDGIINAKSDMNVRKAKLTMGSQKMLNTILENIHSFNANIAVRGDVYAPSINVKSDLDRQLSTAVKSKATAEAKKFERELKSGVLKRVNDQTGGFNTNLGDIDSLLDGKNDMLSGINLDFSAKKSLKGLLPF